MFWLILFICSIILPNARFFLRFVYDIWQRINSGSGFEVAANPSAGLKFAMDRDATPTQTAMTSTGTGTPTAMFG